MKNLDKYGLVKSIKAKDKNRWMFFSHDQEPDVDVVGGKFYIDGEIDEDKIDSIRQKVLGMISDKHRVGYNELAKYLVDNCEEARDLREEDI